jgi:4-amino-4-deoxy-L-arabinose transferase-like glycosyltransferase
MAKIKYPFHWLESYVTWVGGVALLGVAAFFRFYQLGSLPPGLYTGEAKVGLAAAGLAYHGWLPGFSGDASFSPLWIWLQAGAVKLFGHTAFALRLWPALLGVAAVFVVWRWAKDWFGTQVSWIAALLVAVTPWAVTLSRNAVPASLAILLVPLTLWLGVRAYQSPALMNRIWLGAAIILDLFAGPFGWLTLGAALITGLILMLTSKRWPQITTSSIPAIAAVVIGLGGFAWLAWASRAALSHLASATGVTLNPTQLADSFVRTILMFNITGDQSWRHNFSGQPMLNAFIGLMLVVGILAAIVYFRQRRHAALLILFALLLLPAWLSASTAPNALAAAAALPVVILLAAVGINYMLDLWYTTFPINSAARSTGQSVIILLLILTGYQGFTQYFSAWGESIETYSAYEEPAVQTAHFLTTTKFSGQRFVVGRPDELPVVNYINYDNTAYRPIEPASITNLPLDKTAKQFIITAAARDDAAKQLLLKYPGGRLRPQLSTFSQNEIFYTYETVQ